MKKVFSFGKIDYLQTGRRNCPVKVTARLEERDGRVVFTASGEIWNHIGTDTYCAGQCLDTIAKYVHSSKFAKLYKFWKLYHLNDMHPECEHQRQLGWVEQASELIDVDGFINKKEKERRGWVRFDKDERGILCKPCPVCGYKYGSSWVYMEIPDDDLKEIKELLGS